MATITFKNGDAYMAKIAKLSQKASEEVCGRAIYEGAAVMIERTKAAVDTLPESRGERGTVEKPLAGPSKLQKKALRESVGIAKAKQDGDFVNVKIGFDGYNSMKTKRWPQGQPNQLIARAVERGTSFMRATPFMKKAVSSAKKDVLAAMGAAMDEKIEEIMRR